MEKQDAQNLAKIYYQRRAAKAAEQAAEESARLASATENLVEEERRRADAAVELSDIEKARFQAQKDLRETKRKIVFMGTTLQDIVGRLESISVTDTHKLISIVEYIDANEHEMLEALGNEDSVVEMEAMLDRLANVKRLASGLLEKESFALSMRLKKSVSALRELKESHDDLQSRLSEAITLSEQWYADFSSRVPEATDKTTGHLIERAELCKVIGSTRSARVRELAITCGSLWVAYVFLWNSGLRGNFFALLMIFLMITLIVYSFWAFFGGTVGASKQHDEALTSYDEYTKTLDLRDSLKEELENTQEEIGRLEKAIEKMPERQAIEAIKGRQWVDDFMLISEAGVA
jgi:hypothetical protein